MSRRQIKVSGFPRARSQTFRQMGTLGVGLQLGMAGCIADATAGGKHDRPVSDTQLRGTKTSLARASSCDDLLQKVQNDAIAKLDLSIEAAKQRWQNERSGDNGYDDDVGVNEGVDFGGDLPLPP